MNEELENGICWVVNHWDKIPDEFKGNIQPSNCRKSKSLKIEGHIVILLVSRQKPSIESSYGFDEERFGVNRFGEIIWGFDSGCSCPSPWDDSFPECYQTAKSWKQFTILNKDKVAKSGYNHNFFDVDWDKEALETINRIKQSVVSRED